MVDRQDIDALLIGSLYGELSSADEARLQAHLESHPADRAALADLTHARQVVRESRILDVQLDPPQSVSALLMQEAARRAPKPDPERVGWFQRFMRGFMLHPAMAAAAMLVLVVGVAGTIYVRKGDHFAGQSKSAAPAAPAATADLQAARDPVPATGAAAPAQAIDQNAAGSAYSVSLDDDATAADGQARGRYDGKLAEERQQDRPGDALGFEAEGSKGGTAPAAPARKAPRLEVKTESPAPKDFDDAYRAPAKKKAAKPAPKADRVGASDLGGVASGGGEATVDRAPGGTTPARRQMEPSPAPRTSATRTPISTGTVSAPAAPPPPPPVAAQDAKAPEKAADKAEAQPADPELAWAKQQHARALASVRAGNCSAAANIVLAIQSRHPSYYAQHLVNARDLKGCNTYIAQERSRRQQEAERAQRAKKATSAEEPAATPTKP